MPDENLMQRLLSSESERLVSESITLLRYERLFSTSLSFTA